MVGRTDITVLRVAGDEARVRVPDILKKQLEQRYTRHRASAYDDVPRAQFRGGTTRKKHDAANRPIAGNGEVRKQQIAIRVARVLHRGEDTDVELTSAHAPVQVGRHSVDQIGVEVYAATIDCPVNRIAVDVRNSSDLHHAATVPCPPGLAPTRSNTRRVL